MRVSTCPPHCISGTSSEEFRPGAGQRAGADCGPRTEAPALDPLRRRKREIYAGMTSARFVTGKGLCNWLFPGN